jgi:thiosulfate dehydrogenase [quinone] large subunit
MENKLTKGQLSWLVVLRIFIGWHFLYEGMIKVMNPDWSSVTYLLDSKGWFGKMFINMAGNAGLMKYVDFLNEWALVLIGLGLLAGCFTRISCIGGILLLLLYTMSHPAVLGADYKMPFEGSYFLIDKNLVELAGLGVLFVFPTARIIGFDRFLVRVLPSGFKKFII